MTQELHSANFESGADIEIKHSDDMTVSELKRFGEEPGAEIFLFYLGQRYDKGKGVLQDHKEAFRWFMKAAERGHAAAQTNVGVKYYNGNGTLQDHAKAHIWFNLAAANGNEAGKEYRDLSAEEMTSDQIADAQKMAREMVDASPKLMGE